MAANARAAETSSKRIFYPINPDEKMQMAAGDKEKRSFQRKLFMKQFISPEVGMDKQPPIQSLCKIKNFNLTLAHYRHPFQKRTNEVRLVLSWVFPFVKKARELKRWCAGICGYKPRAEPEHMSTSVRAGECNKRTPRGYIKIKAN